MFVTDCCPTWEQSETDEVTHGICSGKQHHLSLTIQLIHRQKSLVRWCDITSPTLLLVDNTDLQSK